MPSYTAFTTLVGKAQAEALGAALERLDPEPYGIGVFEMEDGSGLWEIGAYFHAPPDDIALTLAAAAFGAQTFAVSELPDIDWVAHVRRELAPVVAGRFWLYGSHDADKMPQGVEPLLIEAAMAFGTGHHGTTLGCLRAFDRLLDEGIAPTATVDIGCGTAVLAMAAARVWPVTTPILASDIDPTAVEVAQANLAANNLTDRVQVVEATGIDNPKFDEIGPFGLVFANILKGPLLDLAPSVAEVTAPGGHVILSGILAEQVPDTTEAYSAQGFRVHSHDEIGEWATVCLKKR